MHVAVVEFDYFHSNDISIAYGLLQQTVEYEKFSDYFFFIFNSLRLVHGYFRAASLAYFISRSTCFIFYSTF